LYPAYRAPAEDGQRFHHPPIEQWRQCLDNQVARKLPSGGPRGDLRHFQKQVREEAIPLLERFTGIVSKAPLFPSDQATPWIGSGHQPELYHSGVWYKNFVAERLARQSGAIAVHVVVDTDACRHFHLKVPAVGERSGELRLELEAWDRQRAAMPWELLACVDWQLAESFASRVGTRVRGLGVAEPLLNRFWPTGIELLRQGCFWSDAMAGVRCAAERFFGVCQWQVPMSWICQTRGFARFVDAIVADHRRFALLYNASRDAYRLHHGTENPAQPVPALEQREGWQELPFWVYSADAPTRRSLWVRQVGGDLHWSDLAGWEQVGSQKEGVEAIRTPGSRRPVRIGPKALVTTLYLRAIVFDLFVHGIGGGKYDQITDRLIADWLGCEAPPLCVATATQHWSWPSDPHAPLRSSQVRSSAWFERYHPEVIREEPPVTLWNEVPEESQVWKRCLELKRRLLSDIPPRGAKKHWHRQIGQVNHQILELRQWQSQKLGEAMAEAIYQEQQTAIRRSRELSWSLFGQAQMERIVAGWLAEV
jgi:hypothetical protein